MDYRIGKCSQCGASYKVPASFVHDQARCKECSGVVKLGPPQSAQGGTNDIRYEGDATKVVPAKPEPPKLEEVRTQDAGAKRKSRGTLARLRAERAAQAAAPAAQPAAKASTDDLFDDFGDLSDLGDSTPALAPDAAVVEEETKPRKTAGRKPARASKTAKRAGKSGAARASGKRAGGSRKRGGSSSAKKKGPGGILLVVGILVIGGAAALYFLGGGKAAGSDGDNVAVAAMSGSEQPDEAAAGTQAGEPTGGSTDSMGTTPMESDAGSDATGMDDSAAEADETTEEAEASPFEKPEPKAKKGDPASVDLTAVERCGRARGTSDEEWTEMETLVANFLDLDSGASGPRAGRKLEALGRKAYPILVNHMLTLDYSTDEGKRMGQSAQKKLEAICNGNNFDWADGIEPADVYFNKKVVVAWAQTWKKVEKNIEAFITMAKLDSADSDEAERLRGLYAE